LPIPPPKQIVACGWPSSESSWVPVTIHLAVPCSKPTVEFEYLEEDPRICIFSSLYQRVFYTSRVSESSESGFSNTTATSPVCILIAAHQEAGKSYILFLPL
jgi:hypothetical protein